ncbi:3-methyl-2-oxobutanoate hydroxymethyltransferase [Pseudonocardia acidicola]|uniref:3-methyl-2-oxobutanoate hydroxymethyltransferase n=1 Tax=Pseudonocardia acidicola TaxID=2724939 RepID=A0ABX1S992_9PSEU|nr:3-methyl-2-oxobutanoate hydroxymethyltransferase [Pseudonocardia acidicola]NMH96916.1 3-methyl-2-oxobutanoate hydroxymethyltransferase [Pseudonocardia acidicola]
MTPILQSSCARATTWEEAHYRIDAPIEGRHGARVVALDDGAATLVRRLARETWNGARFYTLPARRGGTRRPGGGDMPLHRTDGSPAGLAAELADGDVVVMVATRDGASVDTVATIGRACARRGIMTAAVVLGGQDRMATTVRALRPHAQVLLVSREESDVADLLTAIRA